MANNGTVRCVLFTLATFASGSTAMAEGPNPKPATTSPTAFVPAGAPTKPAAGAATTSPKPAPGAVATSPKPVAPDTVMPKAAAASAAPSMPTPSKELGAFMKAFEGSWKCETKFAAGSTGPGSPEASAKTTVKIKKEFDGFSWHGEYHLAKTNTMPAMTGVFQVGYDPSAKQATFVSYDSMGAAMMGAGPIAGDSVTFTEEGYMLGIKAKVRETMSKTEPKEIHHKVEVDEGHGFRPMAEDICKK